MLIPFNPHYQQHHHRTPAPPPQAAVKTQLFSLRLPRQLLPRPLVLHHSPSASHGKILGVHICGSLMLSVILPNKIHLFFGTAYHPHIHSAHCNGEQATHLRVPHCSSSALHTSPSMFFGYYFHHVTICLIRRPPVALYPACKMLYSISAGQENFLQGWKYSISALSKMVAASHMWQLSTLQWKN